MKKEKTCTCLSCSWYLHQKSYCMAQGTDATTSTPCCSEFAPK